MISAKRPFRLGSTVTSIVRTLRRSPGQMKRITRALGLMCGLATLLTACERSAGRAVASLSGTPGSASAAGAALSKDTLQGLIDGARKEGQLNLVWGQEALGGTQGIPIMADG